MIDLESRGYGGLIYNFVICRRRCGSACLVINPSTRSSSENRRVIVDRHIVPFGQSIFAWFCEAIILDQTLIFRICEKARGLECDKDNDALGKEMCVEHIGRYFSDLVKRQCQLYVNQWFEAQKTKVTVISE